MRFERRILTSAIKIAVFENLHLDVTEPLVLDILMYKELILIDACE
jgi:hypothetical protein